VAGADPGGTIGWRMPSRAQAQQTRPAVYSLPSVCKMTAGEVADLGGIQAGSGGVVWRSVSASRLGGVPNMRRYSRLNWEGLS
jgi:hypothetical protein